MHSEAKKEKNQAVNPRALCLKQLTAREGGAESEAQQEADHGHGRSGTKGVWVPGLASKGGASQGRSDRGPLALAFE